MRNELIDLYNLATNNYADKDIVKAYQRARDRIGPQIAIHEVLENDSLRVRVAALEAELASPRVVAAMELAEAEAWELETDLLRDYLETKYTPVLGEPAAARLRAAWEDIIDVNIDAERCVYKARDAVLEVFK